MRGDLVVFVPPGVTGFVLNYRVAVPRRQWPFGCVRRQCSLSGALAPLPSAPLPPRSQAHDRLQRPQLDAQARIVAPVRWRIASIGMSDARAAAPIVVEPDSSRPRTHVDIYWGGRYREHSFVHRGVQVRILHRRPRPSAQFPREGKLALLRDVAGRLEYLARAGIELTQSLGLAVELGSELVIVQGPLGSHLVRPTPGGLQVSAQWLELPNWSLGGLLPFARFQQFHEIRAAHGLMETLVARALA